MVTFLTDISSLGATKTDLLKKDRNMTSRWIYRSISAALFAGMILLMGCGGSKATSVAISISPLTATVARSTTKSFIGTVTGTTTTGVTWKILEGSTGGTVSSVGLYTAPATTGTYHVVVTSAADISKSASATITVN